MTVGEQYFEWGIKQGRAWTEDSKNASIKIIDELVKAEKLRMANVYADKCGLVFTRQEFIESILKC